MAIRKPSKQIKRVREYRVGDIYSKPGGQSRQIEGIAMAFSLGMARGQSADSDTKRYTEIYWQNTRTMHYEISHISKWNRWCEGARRVSKRK